MDLLFGLLRVITLLALLLISCVDADRPRTLQSPCYCFRDNPENLCVPSVEYPLVFAYLLSDNCGYPGLEVDCNSEDDERSFMNISNHIYPILEVDYGYKHIRLVDKDAEGSGGCPQPKRNFSFPSSPSWINYRLSYLYNITVFYNCSSVPVDAEKHLLCSKQDTNTTPSYAFYDGENREGFDWYGNCAQNVVVPVSFTNESGYSYIDVIKRGFIMRWYATNWCEDCERSDGLCWSIANSTGCACRNGKSYNKTCHPHHQDDY